VAAQTLQGTPEDDDGLFPGFGLPDRLGLGRVYLASDGFMLKRGYVSRPQRLRQRKGELRGQIISSKPGSRADEDADLERVKRWRTPGTEWFAVPDDPEALYWLWEDTTCSRLCPAGRMLLGVIAANLRQRRAA